MDELFKSVNGGEISLQTSDEELEDEVLRSIDRLNKSGRSGNYNFKTSHGLPYHRCFSDQVREPDLTYLRKFQKTSISFQEMLIHVKSHLNDLQAAKCSTGFFQNESVSFHDMGLSQTRQPPSTAYTQLQ